MTDPPPRHAAFTLTRANIQEAVAWIASQMSELGATERQSLRAQLSAEELLVNAIEHGGREPLSVSVTLSALFDSFRLTLADDSGPFDIADAPQRKADETIETARLGGWGVELVRRFAQRVSYQRINDRNVVALDFTP